jgi:metal-responsive CopG/Arc/MetJ family transcriptional regulator
MLRKVMNMSPVNRVTVNLDDRTIEILNALERTIGTSRSEIVRRAVKAFAEDLAVGISNMLQVELAKVSSEPTKPTKPKATRRKKK